MYHRLVQEFVILYDNQVEASVHQSSGSVDTKVEFSDTGYFQWGREVRRMKPDPQLRATASERRKTNSDLSGNWSADETSESRAHESSSQNWQRRIARRLTRM